MTEQTEEKKDEQNKEMSISEMSNDQKEKILIPQGYKLAIQLPSGKAAQVYEVVYRNVGKLRATIELKGVIKQERPLIEVPGRGQAPGAMPNKSGLILPR